MYGKEVVLDLYGCDPKNFTRENIKRFFDQLCKVIDMKQCQYHFWDDLGVPKHERQTSPHTKGTSAIQFILTSNITIHTLDMVGEIYINIFSCKDFNEKVATDFCTRYFEAMRWHSMVIIRGKDSEA